MELQEENHKNKTKALIIMIVTLALSVIGTTFAYFSITPAINNSVTGVAATADLSLNITRITPNTEGWNTSNQVMIPQLTAVLNNAINNNCLDEYGNVVCQLYKIILNNEGTAQVEVDGTIKFTGTTNMPNLKWKIYGNSTEISNTSDIITSLNTSSTNVGTNNEVVTIVDNLTLNPKNSTGDKQYYYLIAWIESLIDENGEPAIQTDNGTYQATVDFSASNGIGVTSTFTS